MYKTNDNIIILTEYYAELRQPIFGILKQSCNHTDVKFIENPINNIRNEAEQSKGQKQN